MIGVVGGFTAYGLAYLAHQAHDRGSNPQAVALLVVAALALGSGWIVGWVTVESAILDWRAWRNASAVPRTIRVGQPLIRHAMPQS